MRHAGATLPYQMALNCPPICIRSAHYRSSLSLWQIPNAASTFLYAVHQKPSEKGSETTFRRMSNKRFHPTDPLSHILQTLQIQFNRWLFHCIEMRLFFTEDFSPLKTRPRFLKLSLIPCQSYYCNVLYGS